MSYIANHHPRVHNRVSPDRLVLILTNVRLAVASLQYALTQSDDDEASELSQDVDDVLQRLDSMLKERKPAVPSLVEVAKASQVAVPRLVGQSHKITYCSPAMHRVVQMAERVAKYETTVLITGETGVGKELIARLIHLKSPRNNGPMVTFNCAAVPKDLFESQLFGHRQGAFTGANRDQEGVIRASASGTLLLDEIGELSLELQPKLLRFLQEGEIHKLGENRPSQVNVRVIASTNRDLEAEVAAGRFRADLFYRLSIVCLEVPPLRERPEDIPLLINFLLDKNADRRGMLRFAPEALDRLMAYHWPGNVRELRNLLMRLNTFADDDTDITTSDLPPEMQHVASSRNCAVANGNGHGNGQNGHSKDKPRMIDSMTSNDTTLAEDINRLERQRVKEALDQYNGNFSKAARYLGLSTFGLRKKYRRLFADLIESKDGAVAGQPD